MNQLLEQAVTPADHWIDQELDWICEKLETNMKRFGNRFPSACAEEGRFRIKENDDWTNGFWTGMLWIAWLHTGKDLFRKQAEENLDSFQKRLDDHLVLDHHDIGFLYSLSAVAGYRLTEREDWKLMIVRAASKLADRYQEKGGFIQAWGALDNEKEYRFIIDSLLNLPLLYEAYRLSHEVRFQKIADNHYRHVISLIIREDSSTYHTYYMNPKTGEPSHGATHQGFSDTSCWARGQSWAILGIPLHVKSRGSLGADEKTQFTRVTDYFLSHLTPEGIPYWDLGFQKEDDQPYDSSALAIAACGLLEAERWGYYEGAAALARRMVSVLGDHCTSRGTEDEGILLHGVYAYAEGKGIDQANLWGDYYYMEALYRLKSPDWETFW